MPAKAFVVAMAADIARSDYARPTLIRSRSREWMIACRWGPDGDKAQKAAPSRRRGPNPRSHADAAHNEDTHGETNEPRRGDLIVYRSPQGIILHSGIVSSVSPGGKVLVESKWHLFGRFRHAPAIGRHWTNYRYYRSPRNGHLLAGLDPAGVREH